MSLSGEFFNPNTEPPHRCTPPPVRPSHTGWRCDCGRAYVAETVTQHGETWRQWARSPEHDRG